MKNPYPYVLFSGTPGGATKMLGQGNQEPVHNWIEIIDYMGNGALSGNFFHSTVRGRR